MKELIANLKQELKALEANIKALKKTRKTHRNGYVPQLQKNQSEYRVKHIFRCMLRGRTLDQIENSRLKNPKPLNSIESQLHLTLSHLYRNYTNMTYEHNIQCRCRKCKPPVPVQSFWSGLF